MHPDVIAHYKIGEKLGQGGMGEVYRATDTKLGRQVAVKFLPDSLATDPVQMARFTREAQVLASLNHPNIAAIYGVEDRALVMELVEGPTLSDRIKAGAVPLEEALGIAGQIVDALEAAHAKGIVHRDLKPANIKVTPDGTVKVLDFGLAKIAIAESTEASDTAPTMTTTQAGLILGTAGYMSPEQARGKEVDKRADIWAFGVVLYEMLTGTQLFQGDTVTDVMAAVVRQDPDFNRVPAKVQPLLRRCLEKDPKRRLRDIGDAMLLLDVAAVPSVPAAAPRRSSWSRISAAVALLFLSAFAALAFVHFREVTPAAGTVHFQLPYPADLSPVSSGVFAISPDGGRVAYGAFGTDGIARIWLRPLDRLESTQLPGVEINRITASLFWSPDGRHLAYWADQKLQRIDVAGGSAQVIADAPMGANGGSWNRDGIILYGGVGGIMQVPASGGPPAAVTKAAEREPHARPHFLPDGRHFLYLRSGALGSRAVHIGSLDVKPEDQSAEALVKTDYDAIYAPGQGGQIGRLLFVRGSTLMAQPFDAARRELQGEPVPIADPVAAMPLFGMAYVSASDTGTLVYFRPPSPNVQLTWFDREGQAGRPAGEPGRWGVMKLSPDGTRAAIVRSDDGNNSDIWQIDLVKGTSTRFTFDRARDSQPVWSADGTRIAWISYRDGFTGFYAKPADGSGSEELLHQFKTAPQSMTDWTRDGRFLIYTDASDIWALPVSGVPPEKREPIPVIQGERGQLGAYVSPDQRWIAYISNESGQQEMYVQPFAPGTPGTKGQAVSGKWMVSSSGTLGMARWRADSRELIFLGTDGGVMSVDIAEGPVFKASAPRRLFQLPLVLLTMSSQPGAIVDVTKDHQRVLVTMPIVDAFAGLNVVMNWQSALAR
jgi:Tol biopolymer transport system component/predicted Ser/Thr protein kinase